LEKLLLIPAASNGSPHQKGVLTKALLWGAAFALTISAASTASPEDPLSSPGWRHFYNNQYAQAISDFEQDVQSHPDDPQAFNHLSQAVLYSELFRNGALESQLVTGTNPFLRRPKMSIPAEEKKQFDENIAKAFQLAQAQIDKNPKDVSALYSLSVTHALRANYNFLVEKAWKESLRDATASRRYSDRVLEIDPNYTDAYLVQGLHDYIVGSLPFYMRMFGFLTGFHGDREKGIRELEEVAKNGISDKWDARILLAGIYRRERQPKEAMPLLKELAEVFPQNYLFRFEQVQMYSDAGYKAAALEVVSEVERLRVSGAPGYRDLPIEKIEYLRGNLLFWYGDLTPAMADLQHVTRRAQELDLNTAVLAWLRVGQIYDLRGNHEDAVEAYRETVRTAPNSEAANEAKGYISSPFRRKASKS
jgi:tetratricopeptide (TPR) repeat protein